MPATKKAPGPPILSWGELDPKSKNVRLWFYKDTSATGVHAARLSFREYPDGQLARASNAIPHTVEISSYQARRLMDILWALGVKPTWWEVRQATLDRATPAPKANPAPKAEASPHLNGQEAAALHLADLRAILFKHLDIPLFD